MPSNNGRVRVLIAAKERGVRDQLRQIIMSSERCEVAGTAADGQEAVQLAVLLRPQIALIKADLPIFNGYECAEMISLTAPDICNVLIGDGQPDSQELRKAMLSGLRGYVTSPVIDSELLQILDRLSSIGDRRSTPEFDAATDPSLLPKVIIVTGGKGGIGKTTIASGLAMCLASQNPGKVVLFDLYTQFGDVATVLNVEPQKTLSELVQMTDEVDLELLESYMVEHSSGLKILTSAVGAQPIDAISVANAESTLHALKRAYTYIVVDLPPILHSTTLYVLSHCFKMFIVTTLFDMPTLRNGRALYDKVVGTYVPEEKIALIVNRVSKFDKLTVNDVERTFGRPIDAKVPNDHRLVSAVNQGTPFLKAYSKSPVVGAIENIVREIIYAEPEGKGRT